MEGLRQFHLRDTDGRALCGTDVCACLEAAYATNATEVTCADCMRIAYARLLHLVSGTSGDCMRIAYARLLHLVSGTSANGSRPSW